MGNSTSEEVKRVEEVNKIEERRKIDEAISKLHSNIQEEEIKFECNEPMLHQNQLLEYVELSGIASDSSISESITGEVQDARQKVDSAARWPYSVQGLFSVRDNEGRILGSGTIIGPNLVLTCAHNVFKRDIGIELDKYKMSFYPGLNGQSAPYGELKVIEVYYPEEYKDNENEDYALLVLDRNIGYYTGYFGIRAYDRESLKNRKVHLCGYPADKPDQSQYEHYLWGMEGEFDIDPYNRMIDLSIYTSGGQSGSALYIEEDYKYDVIGVHRHTNQAAYLNEARIKKIEGWVKEYYIKYSIFREIDSSKLQNGYEILMTLHDSGIDLSILSGLKFKDCNLEPRHASKMAQASLNSLLILNIAKNKIGDQGAIYLSQSNFINLSTLNLKLNQIGDPGATAISQANFPNLTTLNLDRNMIGNTGAAAIFKSNFIYLKNLNLSNNKIKAAGATTLSQANFIHLNYLYLSGNEIGLEGVTALSQANFPDLKVLDLGFNYLGDPGVAALSKANFTNLRYLNLLENEIGDVGAIALSKACFINLNSLYLAWNLIGDAGASALFQANFPYLNTLNLSGNQIGDEVAAALFEAKLHNIINLELSMNKIKAQGAIALSQAKFMNLKTLNLSQNQIGDEGANALSQSNFIHLKELNLHRNEIGEEAQINLALRLKETNISYF